MSWVQYFWKWLVLASPLPVRVVEISVLLLALIALASKQLFPIWEPVMNALAWQIPLGLLVAVFLISMAWSSYSLYRAQGLTISDLTSQLEIARKQAYPPVTTLMMAPYFKELDIPLGQYGLVNKVMEDKVFDHCRIKGPAVISLTNSQVTGCSFDGDLATTFIITTNKTAIGILGVVRCKFIDCTFENVSIIGSQETVEKMRPGFKGSK